MVSNYKTIPVKNFIDGEACTIQTNIQRKRYFSKEITSVSLGILFISVLILNLTLFIMMVHKGNQIQEMQHEIYLLRHDVNLLKSQFVDDELMQEFTAFEKELESDYDYDMDNESSSKMGLSPFNNKEDIDFDNNYDMTYDNSQSDEDPEFELKTTSLPSTLSVDKNKRSKREVLAATIDGVPIIAESYAERKQRNKTLHRTGEGLKLYETLGKNTEAPGRNAENRKHSTTHTFKTSGWASRTFVNNGRNEPVLPGVAPTPIMSRSSRVMQTNEDKSKAFRRVIKKSMLKSTGASTSQQNLQELVANTPVTDEPRQGHRHRIHRQRSNLETMDERHPRFRSSLPAAHFDGDTSKYHHGTHRHYRGNGHLAHPQGHYIDWLPSGWVKSLGMDRFFHIHNGVLTIKEAGLYFIYAQIFYVDEHDLNGYRIYKNDTEIAQCTTMTHTEAGSAAIYKRNTCYTATIVYFEEGDKLMIKDIESARYAFFEKGKSFFGLYKISDAKIK